MAHHIETHGNQAAAVFARADAWHQLGTTLSEEFTAEQAMEAGHLGGWNVRKLPLTATDLDIDGVITLDVPRFYATTRTNPFTGQPEVLGVVGENYTPIQNEAHAEFLNALVDESGAHFDTAGSLRGGRQVFVTMKMPDHILVGGEDAVSLNLVALNSHDGTSSFQVLVSPVRVVCANTQAAAIGNNRGLHRIRHTANATQALSAAREALDMTFTYLDGFQAEADRMIDTAMTDMEFDSIIGTLFNKPEVGASVRQTNAWKVKEDKLLALWHDAATNTRVKGTRWGGYQAVVEYLDHFAAAPNPVVRAERSITAAPDIKRRTFDLLSVG